MARKRSDRKKRPIAISVIAVAMVVLFLSHLFQVYEPLIGQNAFKNGITGPYLIGWKPTPMGSALLSSAAYLFLAVAGIIVLIGFLRLKRWSWVVLMAWTGISLVISLVDYFYSRPNYLVMASNVIIAFALNIADVQRMFRIRREDGVVA